MLVLSLDVESVGLHGDAFAAGYVVSRHGLEIEHGIFSCPSHKADGRPEDRRWIRQHVLPHLPTPNCADPREVRERFWQVWMKWKPAGAILVADCGWPVEHRFLARCIEDDSYGRNWEGPYPLHEVSTALYMAGMNPQDYNHRLEDESPPHHPVNDARQSGRLFLSATRKIGLFPTVMEAA